MADINDLSRQVNELTGDHMALRAAFESHREHCATDKNDMKAELKGINGKLWTGLVLLALNLLALSAYLAVEGAPWVSQAIAFEGERK